MRAREGKERTTTELSFSTRDQNVYKRGGTRTFPQSPLSQHRQQSLRHVAASYPGGGRIEDLRNRTRDGASQLTEAGPLPVMGGRVELLKNMRRHHTQRLPHGRRRSFHMAALLRSYQDITFLAGHQECRKNSLLGTSRTLPIMEHFSKCGLHSVSYSVIL